MDIKKGISPVVAIALLLVVSVVAVVGYQQWYQGYQSILTSDVEQRSTASGSVNVEFISSDGIIYITNTGTENVSMSTIKIGDTDCNINQELEPGVNDISISSCLNNTGTNEIMLVTDSGIIEESLFVDSIPPPPLDCSSLGLNGGEWITVPGNPTLGTSDFCVMKYEAKNVGGVATSQAALTPWANTNQVNSRTECENLGTGYHLITNAEWMTISRNIESISSNWADGIIGSTIASGGGLKRGNAGDSDSTSYNAGGFADRSIDTNSKAFHTLSNGEVIWDLSGNVAEWVNDTFNTNAESSLGQGASAFYEWTSISGYDYLEPSNSSYDTSHGVGRAFADVDDATASGTIHAFLRGDYYPAGAGAGIYALALHNSPSRSWSSYGFRCAYTP